MRIEHDFSVRVAAAADEPFLWSMLLLAAFPPGAATPEQVQADERLARYVAGWGREGDGGVIAARPEGPVGAAWYRRFSFDAPGHGFVSEDVPELSIAVAPGSRSRGIGRAMLVALIERARQDGKRALSLSVSRRNSVARALYESVGFRQVAGDEGHPTMLLDVACAPDHADEP